MISPEIRDAAMRLLARREHSCAELSRKLKLRGFDSDSIDSVISECIEKDYLNENRFVEMIVEVRKKQGKGPVKISEELGSHNIASDIVATCIDFSCLTWNEIARSVRSKKFGELKPESVQEKAKQHKFLRYRGFTREQISRALKF